ncbi:MAG: OmpA family protein [Flavobacterium sp.]|nr:OmpA family protein [Flavobacterium sp.]
MKRGLKIVFFLFFGALTAQINTVKSVYFELDKFSLNQKEINQMVTLLDSANFSRFKAIYLYGYCDDRGSLEYNDKLSKKRVAFIQNLLLSKGYAQNKIFICEGRGKVVLDKDTVINLKEVRDKNRRVDLILVKNVFYTSIPEHPKIGDNIVLERVTFEMGSSELSLNAKKELDRTIVLLKKHKTLRFEIKGHVCCTSRKNTDGIDKETNERNLSENRARNVFNYLRSMGISPYRMSYKGYGNQFPLGKGDAQDRRVELFVTKL